MCLSRVHRRVHQEEKPHVCNYEGCDKAFKTAAELSRHAFRHTGEKPHKCDQCEKAFIRYDDLKRHYRIHTGQYDDDDNDGGDNDDDYDNDNDGDDNDGDKNDDDGDDNDFCQGHLSWRKGCYTRSPNAFLYNLPTWYYVA